MPARSDAGSISGEHGLLLDRIVEQQFTIFVRGEHTCIVTIFAPWGVVRQHRVRVQQPQGYGVALASSMSISSACGRTRLEAERATGCGGTLCGQAVLFQRYPEWSSERACMWLMN